MKITVDNSPAAEGNLGFWANQVTSELGNDVTNFSDAKVKSVLPHDAYVQAQNGTGIGGVGSISDPNYSRLLTANNPALASAFARLSAAIGPKTSEGLNVRKVSTVAIDPMGNPIGQQSLQTALNAKAAQMAAAKAVPGGVINPAGAKVVNNKVVGGDQSRLAPSTALAFGNGAAVPPPVAAITNALRPPARAALVAPVAKPRGASTVTLAQINQRAPVNITVSGSAPNALRAPPNYNPTQDVTGVSQQHNAGGWGINAGGGIVP